MASGEFFFYFFSIRTKKKKKIQPLHPAIKGGRGRGGRGEGPPLGAGDRSGVPGRQYRDSGEDGGDRRLQCGAGGVPEGEGSEADEAIDGPFGEGRYDSDEAFAGIPASRHGWV